MKTIVEVKETENEGLLALIGKNVTFFAMNYIYVGRLVGVNTTCVKLENPKIVYETGAFTDNKYRDAQALPNVLYIQTGAIESFGVIKES